MREFNEENGSSLGLRDKKVGHSLDVVFVQLINLSFPRSVCHS